MSGLLKFAGYSGAGLGLIIGSVAGLWHLDGEKRLGVADLIVADSIALCDLGGNWQDQDAYKTRLHALLENTWSGTLSYIKDHDIAVCIDSRLSDIAFGPTEIRPDVIFYPDTEQPYLAIRDDLPSRGSNDSAGQMAEAYVPIYLNNLKDHFAGVVENDDFQEMFFGYATKVTSAQCDPRQITRCVATPSIQHVWRTSNGNSLTNTIQNHPELVFPPFGFSPG